MRKHTCTQEGKEDCFPKHCKTTTYTINTDSDTNRRSTSAVNTSSNVGEKQQSSSESNSTKPTQTPKHDVVVSDRVIMSLRVKKVMMRRARMIMRLVIRVTWKRMIVNCVLSVGRERIMIAELRLGCFVTFVTIGCMRMCTT